MAKKRAKPAAFVVYGRDLAAKNALEGLLQRMGFRVLRFQDKADLLGPMPTISAVVQRGISDADMVFVLFTPDELAVLYDSKLQVPLDEPLAARWQSRPNVIFEAGWAFGVKPERTMFVTVGDDTVLFSDVGGLHFVRLDQGGATSRLWSRLPLEVKRALPPPAASDSGTGFTPIVRRRWKFHDELGALRRRLGNLEIEVRTRPSRWKTLLELIEESVRANPKWSWKDRLPIAFMRDIERRHSDRVANDCFWWLSTTGFFQFSQIDEWGDDWRDAIDFASFTERAHTLLEWLGAA